MLTWLSFRGKLTYMWKFSLSSIYLVSEKKIYMAWPGISPDGNRLMMTIMCY